MFTRRLALVALLILTVTVPAWAEVKLGSPFTDHAVLQRDMPVVVWGSADPGEEVTVSVAGQDESATADDDGRWRVELDPMKAGGPHTLKVTDGESIALADVLVGEVWLASGQSNMQWPVSRAADFDAERAAAKHPKIRMFTVARKTAEQPQSDCGGQWVVCSPDTVGAFSATGYFFARTLHEELGVPVGVINSSWGGTPVEAWTSSDAMKAESMIAEQLDSWTKRRGPQNRPARLYNGMIVPLTPYTIRGAIWYQGESNANRGNAPLYGLQLATMVTDWRQRWGQGDWPFILVQLPNFRAAVDLPIQTTPWVVVREQMHSVLDRVPNAGMAVTIDIGEANNIHPKNKQDVGRRLAAWALAKTYGQQCVASGPLLKGHKQGDGKMVLQFEHVGEGLKVKGEELKGFAIAGPDQEFVWAEAEITGPDRVTVWSDEVDDPQAVRYLWAENPTPTLYNSADLPAAPLRTDNWAK